MAIALMLSGSANDAEALKASARFAAADGSDLKVVLAAGYPMKAWLQHLDAVLWELTRAGLRPPTVFVERRETEADRRSGAAST